MGKSCWVKPCVRNSRGQVVESKLWNELYELTGKDHNKTLQLYRIAVNDKFIDSVRTKADFDENGQITARSFLSLSGRMSEIDDTLKNINKEYAKSNITYDEATQIIDKFNSRSFKEDYVPSMSDVNDGEIVDIEITTRDENSVSALQEKLENHKLTKLIIERLKELGVAYDFVGKAKYAGRFSTKDATLANDGLYHLIEISQGGDVNDALIEEAAHLATLSMKDNELIKRLLDNINENTVHELFTEDEIQRADYSTEDGKLELAGILVKKAMKGQRILGYGNFLSRIKNTIYKVFSKGKLSNIISDKRIAKMYAQQIAHGFLFDKNSTDIESAVKETNIELFSKQPRGAADVLIKTLKSINKVETSIRNTSSILAKNMLENVSKYALLEGKNIDDFEPEEIAGIVGTAISNLTATFESNFEDCKDLDFEGEVHPLQVKVVYSLGEIYSSLDEIYGFIQSYLDSYKNREGFEVFDKFTKDLESLRTLVRDASISDKILSLYRTLAAQEIQEILGTDAYKESARMVFKSLKNQKLESRSWSAYELACSYIREKPYTTLSHLNSWIRHNNNQHDIGTQLFYEAVRAVKYNQSVKYNDALSKLSEIEEKVKAAHINVEDFFERLDDGTLTGNFIGPKNYAKYEDQKLKLETELKEKFIKTKKDDDTFNDFMKLTKQQKYADWLIFRNESEEYQNFLDRTHMDENHKILTNEFDNQKYFDLVLKNPQFKELLQEIRDWKKSIDDTCLTEHIDADDMSSILRHADSNRVPMFSKNHVLKAKSKKINREDLYKSEEFKDYCLDVTSDNFGSKLTDTKLTDFNDEYSLLADGVQRISLYGINKLQDMSELSTDLFMSLSLYANMAYRYSTIQEVYPKLMMLDKAFKERTGAVNEQFESDSNKQRQKIINQFITPESKPKTFFDKLWNVAKGFGSLVAIRVLCLSYMSALKNYFGGARVVFNDAAAGNMIFTFNGERINVPIKSVNKMFGKSINPKHLMTYFGSILLNKDLKSDKYKNLVKRWDAARNPHIRQVLGGSTFKKVYNYTINLMMSNFSITDESLIAIIYNSYMDAINVYDAKTLKKVSLTKTKNGAYEFDNNNNPTLRDGLIKDIRYAELYKLLKAAQEEVNDIIENNQRAKDEAAADGTTPVYKTLDDEGNIAINNLLNYLSDNGFEQQMPGLYDSNGRINNSTAVLEAIKNKLNDITFTHEDEINICEQINDYITSSQGLYGALNANAIMSDANTAMFARLKGWLFGFMQRWLFTNPSVLNQDYKSCIAASEMMAFSCVFGNNKNIFDDGEYNWKEDAKFRLAMVLSMCIPFVLNSNIFGKKFDDKTSRMMREYLIKKGWSPDQLSKLSFMCIGFWLQQAIHFLARRLFSRGNYISYGKKTYKSKENRKGKTPKLEESGLIFKLPSLSNSILEDTDESDKRFMQWAKQGFPKVLNRRKNIDTVYSKSELPNIYDMQGGEVFYVEAEDKYYRAKSKDNRAYTWEKVDYGYYEIDSDEYNEHEQAIHYMNYYYDKNSLAYHFAGAMYRLSRAVEDEGDALINPLRLTYEITDIANPIAISGGLVQMYKLVKTAVNEGIEPAGIKELNFWLKKLGLQFDGDGMEIIGSDASHTINLLDWYNTQDSIDRYNETKWYK